MKPFHLSKCKNVVQGFVGAFELFRLMGFTPDEIFAHRNPDGELQLRIEQDDKTFGCTIGFDDGTHEEIKAALLEASEAGAEGRIPNEDITAVVVGTRMLLGDRDGLLNAIRAKGILIRTPEKYR
jgi:hypothetical protein